MYILGYIVSCIRPFRMPDPKLLAKVGPEQILTRSPEDHQEHVLWQSQLNKGSKAFVASRMDQ